MSFYRTFVAAIAAMSLASTAFAAATTQEATQNATKMAAASTTVNSATQAEKMNINKATVTELSQVKGLSTSKARAIVSYRKAHGDFKAVEDLKSVRGFKRMDEKTLQDIESQLTVG